MRLTFLSPLACLVAASLSPAAAETIHVPGDQPTIQAAIDVAVDGDTVLVAPGVYRENLRFRGTAIEVRSSGGPLATAIQGFGTRTVVIFDAGEGPDTVLEGFRIRGGLNYNGGGVFCGASSPTLRGNIISGNRAQAGHGAGLGGGILATDSAVVIEDNQIFANVGDYTGGGICLIRCQATVTGNLVAGNSGASGLGSWGGGIGCMYDGSTLRANTIVGNSSDQGAGLLCYGSTTDVRDTIVWGNTASYGGIQIHVAGVGVPTIEYCDVQDGWTGLGNLDQDPLFQNAPGGDFTLLPASPCIDAGDPASDLDPDGTRADMGAAPFGQYTAAATVRNGSGVNALCYTPTTTPVLGASWLATVDTSGHAGATFSVLLGYAEVGSPFLIGAGEVLVDPTSPLFFLDLEASVGGQATHSLPVPLDYGLSGVFIASQAVVLGGGAELCNAVDLLLGL